MAEQIKADFTSELFDPFLESSDARITRVRTHSCPDSDRMYDMNFMSICNSSRPPCARTGHAHASPGASWPTSEHRPNDGTRCSPNE
ncbi:hypothetical protein DF133_09790 [Burkholderia cenocepacia]|nr:hypothetical protein DF133_09790 [Burkholderia cenocepacia]